MNLDTEHLKQYLPFVPPLVIVAAGWLLLIAPTSAAAARTAHELDALRQRAAQARAALAEPPPPTPSGDRIASFTRQVAAGDATSLLLEELARLASSSHVSNLLIETGARVPVVAGGTGPRVAGAAQSDPRVQLFAIPLAYSPVTISFDADYAQLGEFLWSLRDLATTVEIRSLDVRRPAAVAVGADSLTPAAAGGAIHIAMTLFAYSRDEGSDSRPAGGVQP